MRTRYIAYTLALESTTSLYSPHISRDPISLLIGAVLTALKITGPVASLLTAIATTAITLGLQYLMMPKPPKPEDGRAPLTQAIPPCIYGVGETRVAGAYVLWESMDDAMFSVQAIAAHPIDSVVSFYLNDDEVTLGSPGGELPNMPLVDAGADGRYGGYVGIDYRLGAVPETPYEDLVSFLGGAGVWTNDHTGDGQASVAMVCFSGSAENFNKTYPYGKPQLSAVARLAKVWDFRDGGQDPDDPTTWTFSKNSILILAWHLCFNEFGLKRDHAKAILPVLAEWIEEADICDEDIPRASGGTENRYECNGWDTTESDPKGALNAILATCDGWMCERGDGAIIPLVGKVRESKVVTLSDADIVGHRVRHDVPLDQEINRLTPKFTYPATDYTTSDADYFEDTDAQVTVGRVMAEEADYRWVHQWRQARRLAKREWLRLLERVSGSIDVRLSGINAIYSRWVRLDTPIGLPRLNGQCIENRRSVLDLMKGGFRMEFVRNPSTIDDWTPAIDEGDAPPVPSRPASALEDPTIDTIVAVAQSGSVYIRVVIAETQRTDVIPVVRYRIKDTGGSVPGAWLEKRFPTTTASGGLVTLNTDIVPLNTVLQVQVAYEYTGGTRSDFVLSTPTEVTSTADTVAPAAVTGVSGTGGAGTATINWTSPNSANYAATNIRRNTVNVEGGATLVRTEFGAASTPDSWQDTGLSAGNYFYWLKARNGSGVESAASVATGAVTVT